MTKVRIHKWIAVSLLVGLAVSLLWGLGALRTQQRLAEEVIRLHVIAHSDGAADQALKLRVRDAVLEKTSAWLGGTESRAEAETVLRAHLTELRETAEATVAAEGYGYEAAALLTEETYPTRDYGTFALPGGEYLSLRVILGEGAGRNWWCVVYPPLCNASATEEVAEKAAAAGLSGEEIALITGADEEYVLKFKSIELWENWTARWNGK